MLFSFPEFIEHLEVVERRRLTERLEARQIFQADLQLRNLA
jgi:hypothetical protein